MHICLYNWGDWAKQASWLKYLNLKTFEPPSEAPPINFGEWISMKFLESKYSRNKCATPDWSLNMAWGVGTLKSKTRLSKRVFIFTTISNFSLSFFSSSFFSFFSFFFSFFFFFLSSFDSSLFSPSFCSPSFSSFFSSSFFSSLFSSFFFCW